MKINNKKGLAKILTLFCAVFCMMGAKAENRLYIENFSLTDDQPKKVAVILDNSDPVGGLSCYVVAGDGLTIVGDFERNNDRYAPGQNPVYRIQNPQTARLMVVSGQQNSFIGQSGVIGWITVKADRSAIVNGQPLSLTLDDIVLSTGAGNRVNCDPTSPTTVYVADGEGSVDAGADFVMNPSGVHEISLQVSTSVDVKGISLVANLPEGFRIVDNSVELYKGGNLTNGAWIDVVARPNGVSYGMIITDYTSGPVLTIGKGDLLKFKIQAPADFSDENVQVTFSNVEFSNMNNRVFCAKTESVTIINGVTAYNRALAEVTDLQNELDSALAKIAEEAPDVKDLFTGAEIRTSIDALKKDVENAYADLTLTGNYDDVMRPVEGIRNEIAQLVVNALIAQKDHDDTLARQEAFDNANAQINTLREKLENTLAKIAEVAPDVKDVFTGAEISAMIDALQNKVNEAFENKTIVEEYDNIMSVVPSISDAIDKLLEDAEDAQEKHDEDVAANQKAYADACAVADALDSKLEDTLRTIASECADVKDDFTGDDIKASIAELRKAIETAYSNNTIAGDYDTIIAPKASIEAAIEQLLVDAREAQKKVDEEKAAEALRQETYARANAEIASLEQKLNAALETIAAECPDVKDSFKGETISLAISNLRNAVNLAFENKTIVEKYDEIMAPTASIEASIAQLIIDAKASQKGYEENARLETARLNANAELASLDSALSDALQTIANECPDVKHLFTGVEIQQKITVLRNDVNAAYNDKTLADIYDEVMAPASAIREDINNLVEAAKAAQKQFDDDKAAEQALQEAYSNANARIEALRSALADALATIAETCPDVKDNFRGEPISIRISELKDAVRDAYDAKTLVENYDSVLAPASGIEADIALLVENARAAQKAYEEAEAARRAANLEAYNADLALIESLQTKLDDAKATILAEYPLFDWQSGFDAIQDKIDAEKDKADAEYARVENEGIYNNKVDEIAIEDMIKEYLRTAENSGIGLIIDDILEEGDRIFSPEGMLLTAPLQGKMNIIVKPDGRVLKVYSGK